MPLKYPNELLFEGVPVKRFLDMTKEDIEAEFGVEEPIYQNYVTGDDVYSYSSDDGSSDLLCVTYSKKTGKVMYIRFWSSDCSYNRKSLSKPWYRVDDILQERDDSDEGYLYGPDLYPSGVYGSVHTGFQYYDGVYWGDTLDASEILAQQEFADDYNSKFCAVRVVDEGGIKDYKLSLMYSISGDKMDVSHVSLYTDEWVEAMNATLDTTPDVSSSVDTPDVPDVPDVNTQDIDKPADDTQDVAASAEGTIRFDTEFYSLEVPAYWADLCMYSQWDIDPDSFAKSYGITFYEKQSYDDYGGEGGELFSLALYRGDIDEYYDFPDYLYLGELSVIRLASYDVVATFPTDVQFSEAGQENYLRLSKDIDGILASFTPQSDPECEYTPAA